MTAVAIGRIIRDTYHNVRSYRDYVAPIRLILVKISPTTMKISVAPDVTDV